MKNMKKKKIPIATLHTVIYLFQTIKRCHVSVRMIYYSCIHLFKHRTSRVFLNTEIKFLLHLTGHNRSFANDVRSYVLSRQIPHGVFIGMQT